MFVLYYVKIAAIVYIGVVAFLFFTQRSLIYFPDKNRPRMIEGAEIVSVRTSDGLNLESWYFPPKDDKTITIVYFHGNAGNYSHRLPKVRGYLRLGYGVLLAEYRGYGGNPGGPSEQGFYADGRAYIDWLKREKKPEKIVIYGESIGSGTAVQMATEYDVSGLVLETPFTSLVDIAAAQYFFVPVRYLLQDRFDNIGKITKVKAPKLVLHGLKDGTIPYASGRSLFDAAPEPKNFVDFPDGGHNNLYDFAAADYVIEFLNRIQTSGE